MVRAKFYLAESTDLAYAGKRLKFYPQYDPDIPEDQRFSKATPNGELTIQIDNPIALAAFTLGEYYYLDFTPVVDTSLSDTTADTASDC